MKFNKKGGFNILAPVVVFVILNLIFFSMLLYFVFKQSTGAVVYEDTYAKKIALLVDNSRCNSEIILNVSELSGVLKKNKYELENVFSFNDETSEVKVQVASKGGYMYKHFSNCELSSEIRGDELILKIGHPRAYPQGVGNQVNVGSDGSMVFLSDGSKDFEKIPNCKENFEQRKLDLEIPDKLCYWEVMTDFYDETCENLNRDEISEMFEKKEQYRQLENPLWPNINSDGDFCIPVIYDCDLWIKYTPLGSDWLGFFSPNRESTGGSPSVAGNPSGEIHLNPYLNFSKDFVQGTLRHEGMHSLQEVKFTETHLGEGEEYVIATSAPGVRGSWAEILRIRSSIEDYIFLIGGDIDESFDKNSLSPEERVEYDKRMQEITSFIYLPTKERVSPEDWKVNHDKVLKFMDDYNIVSQETREFLDKISELNAKAYDYDIKTYLGEKVELDPRLSEVVRWWIERTAPECELIYTTEKAKEVLDEFLSQNKSELSGDSLVVYEELTLLIYVYKNTEYEDEVYDELVSRLPGLARADDSYNDGGIVSA